MYILDRNRILKCYENEKAEVLKMLHCIFSGSGFRQVSGSTTEGWPWILCKGVFTPQGTTILAEGLSCALHWSWLEPSVSSTRQLQPLLTGAGPVDPPLLVSAAEHLHPVERYDMRLSTWPLIPVPAILSESYCLQADKSQMIY